MRSLFARAPGRLTRSNAGYRQLRWRACLAPPADAGLRAARLGLDLERLDAPLNALANADAQQATLLAQTQGQVLTSLPGVAVVRAAGFAAHSLPIERFPTAERLYSATGLAPASYQSATINRRSGISRQGLPDHRDALMAIAWGLSQSSPAFRERAAEYRARGFAPIQTRVALARHACRLCTPCFVANSPTTRSVIVKPAGAGGDGEQRYAARRRNLACRPPAPAAANGDNESPPHDGA